MQVIQNYLNGREDPEWNVLPTKKENKYIVKRRAESPKEEPLKEQQKEIIKDEPKPIPPPQPKPSAPAYDPTLNIEILNQLKLLGEEMKHEREKKEQKRMFKEVMQKQMNKFRYQYTIPQYIQEPNEIDDDDENNEPQVMPQPIIRRRNNIFSDMY